MWLETGLATTRKGGVLKATYKKHTYMNDYNAENPNERNWDPPTFIKIPISFEASSYALTDDDPPFQ
jgi:hypothetical protein